MLELTQPFDKHCSCHLQGDLKSFHHLLFWFPWSPDVSHDLFGLPLDRYNLLSSVFLIHMLVTSWISACSSSLSHPTGHFLPALYIRLSKSTQPMNVHPEDGAVFAETLDNLTFDAAAYPRRLKFYTVEENI
jgi:hypothetical protein